MYPNRFKGLKYVNVNALRVSFLVGCLFNLVLAISVLVIVGLFAWFASATEAQQQEVSIPLPIEHVTVAFLPTASPPPSPSPPPLLSPVPTSSPWPTLTPGPTSTIIPTLAPLPTPTPFTLTIVLAAPAPSPTRLYDLGELLAGAPRPVLISEKKYAFYRAMCLDGLPRIEPRVVGLPQIVQGLHWRLWNDYGWSSDTANEKDFPDAYTEDITFFLSSDASQFHLALFYYEQAVSDEVLLDYPGDCGAMQVIYLPASRAPSGFAFLPGPNGSLTISQTEFISVSVAQ